MKRIILFSALLFMAVSCMVPEGGNNELWVSGTEFVVEDCGGEVIITTSGVVQCSIAEIAGEDYEAVNLRLNADEPISHEGSWYSFRSENDGKKIQFNISPNETDSPRSLKVSVMEADLYNRIIIEQKAR